MHLFCSSFDTSVITRCQWEEREGIKQKTLLFLRQPRPLSRAEMALDFVGGGGNDPTKTLWARRRRFSPFPVAPALPKLPNTWNKQKMTHAGGKNLPTGASGPPPRTKKQVSVCQMTSMRSAGVRGAGLISNGIKMEPERDPVPLNWSGSNPNRSFCNTGTQRV